MANNIYSAYHYACKTKADREKVEELTPQVIEAANRAVSGNIGDIKYTVRTNTPNGGFWCDGQLISKAELPKIYDMLLNGDLLSVSMEEYEEIVTKNGSCGFFGLDGINQSFRIPLLSDIYLKAGQEPETFAQESLPNITGKFLADDFCWSNNSGAFYKAEGYNYDASSSTGNGGMIGLDASRSSPVYQNNAKVNPDNVKYRAYIILYSGEKETSIVNWSRQLDAFTEELKRELLNYGATTITYWD